MTKICTKCQQDKEINLFNYRNKSKGLIKSICSLCEAKYNADRYLDKKDEILEKNEKWKERSRDKFLLYQQNYNKNRKKKE